MKIRQHRLCSCLLFVVPGGLYAQSAPPSAPADVLIFNDGEKLAGKFERSSGSSLTFKSDMIGEITVDWSKVKELHTSAQFAVIPKGVDLSRHADTSKIPQGTVTVADQKIEVSRTGQPPQTVAVGDAGHVVDEAVFQNAVQHNPRFFSDWKGALTGGAALVQATQDSRTFTGNINLIRAVPAQDWLEPRNRTAFDFSAAYGRVTQPGTPDVKTEIYHADAERDEYFRKTLFGFGQASFDHNFSQGLVLQQNYGGGIGWTTLKTDKEELDLKASIAYVRQEFQGKTAAENLVGSTLAENFNRKFRRGMLFVEQLGITNPWNNTNAWSAVGSATFTMPFYKRLSLNAGTIDTFLNNPPPGFRKNSFQLTSGVTYSLK